MFHLGPQRRRAHFSVKRQVVKMSDFVGLVSSPTHLSPCVQEAAISNMLIRETWLLPIKLYCGHWNLDILQLLSCVLT